MSWRRDGGALPPTATQIQTVLRIDRVTDQDSGRYICSGQAGEQYVDLRIERKFLLFHDIIVSFGGINTFSIKSTLTTLVIPVKIFGWIPQL